VTIKSIGSHGRRGDRRRHAGARTRLPGYAPARRCQLVGAPLAPSREPIARSRPSCLTPHSPRCGSAAPMLRGWSHLATVLPRSGAARCHRRWTMWAADFAPVYGSASSCVAVSASYHAVRGHQRRPRLGRLDHATIFLAIAGTYTPSSECPSRVAVHLLLVSSGSGGARHRRHDRCFRSRDG